MSDPSRPAIRAEHGPDLETMIETGIETGTRSVTRVMIRGVAHDQWDVVAWLWQCFRHDLALAVGGLPYADGRYQVRGLADFPAPDRAGYLAWAPHPNTGEDAPVGFALVDGLGDGVRRSVAAFWTAPVYRRTGLGSALARHAIARHRGEWTIAFQHTNPTAGAFWRRVATEAFGAEGAAWTEQQRPIPAHPDRPHDHWIETSGGPPAR